MRNINELQRQKIKQFMDDALMQDAVYTVLLNTFLQTRDGDTMEKAAQRISIDFLSESWHALDRVYASSTAQNKEEEKNNPAL